MESFLKDYRKNKSAVIAKKTAAMKLCDAINGSCMKTPTTLNYKSDKGVVVKEVYRTKATTRETSKILKRTIVGSTNYWFDNHSDVHVEGCFDGSDKAVVMPAHLHDHLYKIKKQIGTISYFQERKVLWRDLNVNKDGYTSSLFIDTTIEKRRSKFFFKEYKANRINQHSVGMLYIDVVLAVNSDEKWAAEEKAAWDEFYPLIANQDAVKDHFWVVKKAELIEVSAVLRGSNILTHTVQPTKEEEGEGEDELLKAATKKSIEYIKSNLNMLK